MQVKVQISVSPSAGYGDKTVEVALSEEAVGGDYDTDAGTVTLTEAIERLVDEAQTKALRQIEGRRILAESSTP